MTNSLTLLAFHAEAATATVSLRQTNGSVLTATVPASHLTTAVDQIASNAHTTHIMQDAGPARIAAELAKPGSLFVYNHVPFNEHFHASAPLGCSALSRMQQKWWTRLDASTTDNERAECRRMIRAVNFVLGARHSPKAQPGV
jgi:hypothetical protein